MNQGRFEQLGTPKEIYECPASHFVADFIGKINLIKGFVAGNGSAGTVDVLVKTGSEDVVLHVPSTRNWSKGVEINVSIRPERIELLREARGSDDDSIRIRGTVRRVAFYGGEIGYKIAVGLDTTLSVFEKNSGQNPVEAGQEITLRLRIEDCNDSGIDAEIGSWIGARSGIRLPRTFGIHSSGGGRLSGLLGDQPVVLDAAVFGEIEDRLFDVIAQIQIAVGDDELLVLGVAQSDDLPRRRDDATATDPFGCLPRVPLLPPTRSTCRSDRPQPAW